MILPDVNLLVYAHDRAAPRHEPAMLWWSNALADVEVVGLAWVTLLGFIRITTSRAVFMRPMTVAQALTRVEAWLTHPNVRILHPTHRHPELLADFLRAAGTAGNLTTDAHLAALAMEHGCVLYSTDADFGRFPGLTWRNPLLR